MIHLIIHYHDIDYVYTYILVLLQEELHDSGIFVLYKPEQIKLDIVFFHWYPHHHHNNSLYWSHYFKYFYIISCLVLYIVLASKEMLMLFGIVRDVNLSLFHAKAHVF